MYQNLPQDCPYKFAVPKNHVVECYDRHRQAFDHLVGHLNGRVNVYQRKELQKAFELYREAQAKLEILIAQCDFPER